MTWPMPPATSMLDSPFAVEHGVLTHRVDDFRNVGTLRFFG